MVVTIRTVAGPGGEGKTILKMARIFISENIFKMTFKTIIFYIITIYLCKRDINQIMKNNNNKPNIMKIRKPFISHTSIFYMHDCNL